MMRFALALAMAPGIEPGAPPPPARPDAAAADAFALRWDAPPECPGEADVLAAIERHLAAALVSPRGDGLRVEAVARARKDARWEVQLVVESAEGRSERTIGDARDCAEATETAALVVAIAIDPDVALRDPNAVVPTPTEPAASATPPTTPTPLLVPARPAPPVVAPRPRPTPLRLRAAIGARADVGFGALPRVGFGGTAFVDLLLGTRARVGIGASISGAPPLAIDGGGSVRMLRWSLEARGCPVFGVRRWLEVVPCVGVQAGQTRVDVRGLANERDPRHPWVAPMAQVAVVFVPISAVGIWLGAYGLVPITKHRYEVLSGDGGDDVHTTAPVAGGALVGIEARFP